MRFFEWFLVYTSKLAFFRQNPDFIVTSGCSSDSYLDQLARRYGSDKGGGERNSLNPERAPHNYAGFYSKLFLGRRTQIGRVLECGIGSNDPDIDGFMGENAVGGASLRMWRDYFPNASIVGVDIDPKCMFTDDKISTFVVDQLEPESINAFVAKVSGGGKFDVIIDDGLHTFQAGRTFLEGVAHLLSTDGVYVIEDVHMKDLFKWRAYLSSRNDLVADFVSLSPVQSFRSDNNLIVLRHANSV